VGRRNNLVPVLPGAFSFKLEVWICMHETLRGTPRIRLMFDYLARTLGDYVAEVP
jgi:DNA-binding transcriptional LysR family regulator